MDKSPQTLLKDIVDTAKAFGEWKRRNIDRKIGTFATGGMKWGRHTRVFRGIMSIFQDSGVDLTDRGRAKLRYRKCRKIDFFWTARQCTPNSQKPNIDPEFSAQQRSVL